MPPAGQPMLVSMNCWRFDARIFAACRDVAAVAARRARAAAGGRCWRSRAACAFRAVPARGPVLDLSRRGDAAEVARRLRGASQLGHDQAAALAGQLVAAGLDAAERAGEGGAVRARRSTPCRDASATAPTQRGGCPAGSKSSARTPTTPAAARWSRAVPRGFAFLAARRAGRRVITSSTPARRATTTRGRRPAGAAGALPRLAPLRRGHRAPARAQFSRRARSAPTSCSPAICRARPA